MSNSQVIPIACNDDLTKMSSVEVASNVLNQVLQLLREHNLCFHTDRDTFARQVLNDMQLNFNHHFEGKEMLKQFLK